MRDVLTIVIEDPENQELLRVALALALHKDPVGFYKDIIAPRALKLTAVYENAEFASLTPAEEAALMSGLTVGHEEHIEQKQLAEARR